MPFVPGVTRRDLLRGVLAGLATSAWGCADRRRPAAGAPNVLFLVLDDLNDWLGCLGHPTVRSPNIDDLAAAGVCFTRAYTPSPLCHPARVSVLTGLGPATTGVYLNEPPLRAALPEAVTLPEHFAKHGYHTVGVGKVFHAYFPGRLLSRLPWRMVEWVLEERWGSWDDFVFARRGARASVEQAIDHSFEWGRIDGGNEKMDDWRLARWVSDQLGRGLPEPFFLACGFQKPHLPWHVPAKYFDLYRDQEISLPPVNKRDTEDLPPIALEFHEWSGHVRYRELERNDLEREALLAYLASITFVDRCVGIVNDALRQSRHGDNTIVVLWSDNGWHLGQKLYWGKATLWEESCRVPFIIAGPGISAGRCERTVSLIDIFPTLTDLCGLTPVGTLEGASLVPLLRDPQAAWERPALMTFEWNNHSVRSERWRYTRYADGTEELYDHDADPLEWENLAGRPDLEPVKQELARWLPRRNEADKSGWPPRGPQAASH